MNRTIPALMITRHGGPEVLQMREIAAPKLFPKGVRIAVKAAGVNFADTMMRMGLYPEAPKVPFIPGYEVAGVVTELGEKATGLKIGDRVVAGTLFGGYTTETVVPSHQVRKIPDEMSDIEAAAVPVNFITAWVAIDEMARVRKGDRVLIQSAAGGVGVAAIQLAVNAGAEVVGIVGSMEKAPAVKGLGAAEVITRQQWEDMDDASAPRFTTILDCEGGSSLKRNFRRLSPGGRLISYGAAQIVTGQKRSLFKAIPKLLSAPFFHPLQLMKQNKGVFGINILVFAQKSGGEIMGRGLDKVLEEFKRNRLKTVIGKTFPLQDAAAAHAHLQSRSNIGKVVLTCS